MPVSPVKIITEPISAKRASAVSFKATFTDVNYPKDPNQIMFIAPEDKAALGSLYNEGGLAVVAKEAPESWQNRLGADVRMVLPYHGNCLDGGIWCVRVPNAEIKKGKLQTEIDDLISQDIKHRKESVKLKFHIKKLGKNKKKEHSELYEKRRAEVQKRLELRKQIAEKTRQLNELKKYYGNSVTKMDKNGFPVTLHPDWVFKQTPDYVLKKGEFFALVDDIESGSKKLQYRALIPTDIKGEVTSIKESYLETQKVPYRFFKEVFNSNPKGNPVKVKYFVHTPQGAAMKKAYGGNGEYHAGQIIGSWNDKYYADFNNCVVDARYQLAEKEGFVPASYILNDRPTANYASEVARVTAEGDNFFKGTRTHFIYHNPGRDYQGYYAKYHDFIRITFDPKDFEKMKNHPQFYEIKHLISKGYENLKEDQKKAVDDFFRPYVKKFLDSKGTANISMIPIAAAKTNKDYFVFGTVSQTYGKESRTKSGIAYTMTEAFKNAYETIPDNVINVTNGSTPAAMATDSYGNFGQAGNLITDEHKYEYTVFRPEYDKEGNIINYETPLKDIKEYQKKYSEYCTAFDEAKSDFDKRNAPIIKIKQEIAKIKKSIEAKVAEMGKINEAGELIPDSMVDEKDKLDESLKYLNKRLAQLKEKLEEPARIYYEAKCNKDLMEYSVHEAKKKNTKWILDLIDSYVLKKKDSKGKEIVDETATKLNLEKLFFNDIQREKKKLIVHGYLTKFQNGDKIFPNWGRSDAQKGFSTFLQAFYKFLKSDAPESDKIHAKLLFGSAGRFPKDSEEYKIILDYLDKIKTYDGGKYAGNVCYIEGFFPNRIANCSTFANYTSRFEPCGITPFESYAAGTPVTSINTGGAPDFVYSAKVVDGKLIVDDKTTGLLTKDPFMLEPDELEKMGKFDQKKAMEDVYKELSIDSKTKITCELSDAIDKAYAAKLDAARRDVLSDQCCDNFKILMRVDVDSPEYKKMSQNCFRQKTDWHENAAYNNGKTANEVYFEKSLGIEAKKVENGEARNFIRERSNAPMKKLTDEVAESVELPAFKPFEGSKIPTTAQKPVKFGQSWIKKLAKDKRTYIVAAAAAVFVGIASYALNRDKFDNSCQKPKAPKKPEPGKPVVYYA